MPRLRYARWVRATGALERNIPLAAISRNAALRIINDWNAHILRSYGIPPAYVYILEDDPDAHNG